MKSKKFVSFFVALLALPLVGCESSPASSVAPSSEPPASSAPTSQPESTSENPSSEPPASSAPTSQPESTSENPSSEPTPSSAEISSEFSSVEPSSEMSSALPSSEEPEGLPALVDLDVPAVCFHYNRKEWKQGNNFYALWLWGGSEAGANYLFNYSDDYGVCALYPLSNFGDTIEQINFIVKLTNAKGDWLGKDPDGDREVVLADYEADAAGCHHVYLKTNDSSIYYDAEGHEKGFVRNAEFLEDYRIHVTANLAMQELKIYEDNELLFDETPKKKDVYLKKTGFETDFSKVYTYKAKLANGDEREGEVSIKSLYGSEKFNELYAYDGELGAIYTKEKTTFKVWSPFSSKIVLKVYSTGTPLALGGSDDTMTEKEMEKGEKGVFSCEISGDMEGLYYTYSVTNSTYQDKEIVDPYARSAGVNGLRGMVVDFSKTNPNGWDNVKYMTYPSTALTVYETHVADVTSSETWTGTEANRKLFAGMHESGTTYTEGDVTVKTGFDHIKELGVNAVQILPFFDQANDEVDVSFNWGYNPLNYNVVEGCYSSNPYDGYVRIRELKELIKDYHDAGIAIIMDVVYNHVNGAIESNFDVLFPGYYFRYNGSTLSSGSGCGNDTASEHYMFRKFMIDSTAFWMDEYKIDGYRFDLMGLHDTETMNLVAAKCHEINPNATLYGEPWDLTTPLDSDLKAIQANGLEWEGFGGFNDKVRDALHGGVFDDSLTTLGWCDAVGRNTKTNSIISAIKGATAVIPKIENPIKTVNYVSCHDNRTLFDRILATGEFDAEEDYEDIKKMSQTAHSVVFLSEGISFMLAGEEFLRTKYGEHNSYKSSYKVNELDYSLKVKNLDMFKNFQAMINLKQNLECLHLSEAAVKAQSTFAPATTNTNNSCIKYVIEDGEYAYTFFIVNGVGESKTFDLSDCQLVYSSTNKDKVLSAETALDNFETLVVRKAINA